MRTLKNLNLLDIILPLPETKGELSALVSNGNDDEIDKAADTTFNEYGKHLHSVSNSVDRAANLLGLYADYNLLTGNVLGTAFLKLTSAGIKVTNHLLKAGFDNFSGGYFAENKSENLVLPYLLATDVLSAVPYCTILSPTFDRMVKRKMYAEMKEKIKE